MSIAPEGSIRLECAYFKKAGVVFFVDKGVPGRGDAYICLRLLERDLHVSRVREDDYRTGRMSFETLCGMVNMFWEPTNYYEVGGREAFGASWGDFRRELEPWAELSSDASFPHRCGGRVASDAWWELEGDMAGLDAFMARESAAREYDPFARKWVPRTSTDTASASASAASPLDSIPGSDLGAAARATPTYRPPPAAVALAAERELIEFLSGQFEVSVGARFGGLVIW
jgi:hypothetical protein